MLRSFFIYVGICGDQEGVSGSGCVAPHVLNLSTMKVSVRLPATLGFGANPLTCSVVLWTLSS